ncbi:MAG: hypothetical protein WBQ75_23305 [Acetobacteraceae bacterium]
MDDPSPRNRLTPTSRSGAPMELEDAHRLHDATLLAIEVNWASRSARITFRQHPNRKVHLTASGARSVVVPHDAPWGPSVSVNEVRQAGTPAGDGSLEIEMQSGDVIRVDAEGFTWS